MVSRVSLPLKFPHRAFVDAEARSVRLFQRLTHRRRQGLGVNGLIVVEAAAEAKRHTDQQRACDELTCVIHDVKSPVFELGD